MNWLKRNWKKILIVIGLILAVFTAFVYWPLREDLSGLKDLSTKYTVKILRDTYGVPHIFGHTDADAAYGLAYAHSEDDFLTIQQVLLAARGNLASVYGKRLRACRLPGPVPARLG
jgi:acyl-homoserine-lactone acylase